MPPITRRRKKKQTTSFSTTSAMSADGPNRGCLCVEPQPRDLCSALSNSTGTGMKRGRENHHDEKELDAVWCHRQTPILWEFGAGPTPHRKSSLQTSQLPQSQFDSAGVWKSRTAGVWNPHARRPLVLVNVTSLEQICAGDIFRADSMLLHELCRFQQIPPGFPQVVAIKTEIFPVTRSVHVVPESCRALSKSANATGLPLILFPP